MVGIANAMTGFKTLFASNMANDDLLVCAVALLVMIVASLRTSGRIQIFCALLGILAGYTAAAITEVGNLRDVSRFRDLPLFAVPSFPGIHFSFRVVLFLPFAIVSFTAAIKQVGFIVNAIELEGEVSETDIGIASRRGVLADALGTIAGGLLGGLGVNFSASSQGIIAATGVAARRVCYAIAVILILLGLQPHFAMMPSVMPGGVIAAVLIFTSIFVVANGLQTIVSAGLVREQIICVGLALLGGLATDAVPQMASRHQTG